jgi:acetyl esterase/lipase
MRHIMFAARNVVEVDWLPSQVLIIHGGNDKLVPSWQSVWLADLLNGLDVPTTLRQYARLAHFDTITSLMAGLESKNTEWLLHDSELR